MPIIDTQDATMESDGYGISRSNVSAFNQSMQRRTSKDVLRTKANGGGPEEFAGRDEIDLGSEIVSKEASLEKRLSSVREGMLDVLNIGYPLFSAEELKEIEGMVSSLEESIALSKDIDRNKETREVNVFDKDDIDFASGNIKGGFLVGDKSKNEGLSSLPLVDIPRDYVLDSLPTPDYVPNSLPSPTYASLIKKEFGEGFWEMKPVGPIHPYEIDAYKTVLDYRKKFGPRSCSLMMLDIPEDYEPDSLPSPTYASPAEKEFGPGYLQSKPEWPIHPYEIDVYKDILDYQQKFCPSSFRPMSDRLRSSRSCEDGDNNDQVPICPKKHENSSTKRKGADDYDLESPALNVKKPRTELDVPRVMATTGGWLEEWVMTGTAGWLED